MVSVQADLVKHSQGQLQSRTDEETRRLIVAAAIGEFLESGFSASMDAVARRAGVSKKTIYRVVTTKADLLIALLAERREAVWQPIDAARIDGLGAQEALESVLGKLARLALSQEFIGLCRLISAESIHFPEMAAAFYNEEPKRSLELIAGVLERLRERGLVDLRSTSAAAAMLLHMITGPLFTTAVLGLDKAPCEDEINQRVKDGVAIFLQGCARRQSPPNEEGSANFVSASFSPGV
jgi:AcrR family transcriptional regulator